MDNTSINIFAIVRRRCNSNKILFSCRSRDQCTSRKTILDIVIDSSFRDSDLCTLLPNNVVRIRASSDIWKTKIQLTEQSKINIWQSIFLRHQKHFRADQIRTRNTFRGCTPTAIQAPSYIRGWFNEWQFLWETFRKIFFQAVRAISPGWTIMNITTKPKGTSLSKYYW